MKGEGMKLARLVLSTTSKPCFDQSATASFVCYYEILKAEDFVLASSIFLIITYINFTKTGIDHLQIKKKAV